MLKPDRIRNFSRVGDGAPIPNLIDIQISSYACFLQAEANPLRRKSQGLEALLREIFPIVSYDEQTKLEYLSYDLDEPRYTVQECRDLRLTYGRPLRIRCRLSRKDSKEVLEESIYIGEIPTMIGGGEFIINGAERVIVSQLHRSPGVDFTVEMEETDRPLHGARIIPERGSWIELAVTKKDALTIRIDQSTKTPATTFLRAMNEKTKVRFSFKLSPKFLEGSEVTLMETWIAEINGRGNVLEIPLDKPTTIDHVVTMEDISHGERVREYVIEGLVDGNWQKIAEGTAISHKKIDRFDKVQVSKVRLRVTKSAVTPIIRKLAVYDTRKDVN